MDAGIPDRLRQQTDEALSKLHESNLSIQATVADARRLIETSREVLDEVNAKLTGRITRDGDDQVQDDSAREETAAV